MMLLYWLRFLARPSFHSVVFAAMMFYNAQVTRTHIYYLDLSVIYAVDTFKGIFEDNLNLLLREAVY